MCKRLPLTLLLIALPLGCGKKVQPTVPPAPLPATVVRGGAAASYADSADGLQAQFADVVLAARSHDQVALKTAIDSLGLPQPDTWIAAHFDPSLVSQLVQDYSQASSRFQSHIWWVMENFAKFDDFALKVGPFGMPEPLADSGFESLLPRPLDRVETKNCRFTSTATDPKHGPPSWVSSFVYVDRRFRFVGGTYPFWAEKLTALRGPMSMSPAVIRGMTVQGVAFQKHVSGPGIVAVVQLRVDITRDGRASHIKVLSGEEPFIQDAKDYVKAANFGALPDIPGLANTGTQWDIAVAFFKPKN